MADFGGDYSGDYGGDISGPGISADSSSGFGFSGPGYDSFGTMGFDTSGGAYSDGSGLQDLGGVFGSDLGSSLVGMDTGMGVDYGLSSMFSGSPEGFSFGGTPSSVFGNPSFTNMPQEEDGWGKFAKQALGILGFTNAAKGVVTGTGIPTVGPTLGMFSKAQQMSQGGKPASNAIGNIVGPMAMAALGVPGVVAGALGLTGMYGKAGEAVLGDMPSYAGPTQGNGPGAGGGGMNDLTALLGLGALLYGNRQNQNALGKQISGLQGLYGPNSAYAQQLRLNLARQDAARGRSRDFSGREVQLQAALADAASRTAPTLANLNQQKQANRMNFLAGLGYLNKRTGAMDRLGDWGQVKLGSLYDNSLGGGFGSGSDYGYEDLGQYF